MYGLPFPPLLFRFWRFVAPLVVVIPLIVTENLQLFCWRYLNRNLQIDISVFWSFWFYFVLILLVLSFFCYFLLFQRSFVIPHILYIFVLSIFLPEIPLVYRIPGTVLVSCSFSLWKFFQSNFVTENWRTLLFSESIPLNKSKGLQHVQFLYRSHSPGSVSYTHLDVYKRQPISPRTYCA